MSPKILYICTAVPYGEVYGMGLRTRNIGLLLKKLGDVTTVAITQKPWSEEATALARENLNLDRVIIPERQKTTIGMRLRREIDAGVLNTHSLQLSREDQVYLSALAAKHDVSWIHLLKTANITGIPKWPNSVLDVDDFPSNFHLTVARQTSSLAEKLDRYRRHFMWKRREAKIKERFDSIVVCKEKDRDAFAVPERTFVVGNGFERLPNTRLSYELLKQESRLGIIGNFNYRLNTDATEWLLKNVWHSIREKQPNAQLRLVGRGGEKYHAPEIGVHGLGFVDDPGTELGSWSAMLAPTRMGGGTSVKIAEAFSRKIPVIATEHGARGYKVEHQKGILIADTPEAFARSSLRLLDSPEFGAALAENAFHYFENNLIWDSMLPEIQEALEAASRSKSETRVEKIA